MYPGQHDLLETLGGEGGDPVESHFGRHAPAGAAGIGDDAVGAARIAAVLHLQKGARVLGEALKRHAFPGPLLRYVGHHRLRLVPDSFQEADYVLFLAVAQDQVHAGEFQELFTRHLRVAAGDHDAGLRVHARRAPDQSAGLGVGLCRDGAAVYDVDVGGFGEGDHAVPLLLQGLGHGCRLELVDLATEGGDGDSLVHGVVL